MPTKNLYGIVLAPDYPGLPYRPGDIFTGSLRVPSHINAECVKLVFSGEARFSSQLANDRPQYFDVRLLKQTIEIKPDSDGNWKFKIPIPETTDVNADHESLPKAVLHGFATAQQHPLPPTLPAILCQRPRDLRYIASIAYSIVPVAFKQFDREVLISLDIDPHNVWITSICGERNTKTATERGPRIQKELHVASKNLPKAQVDIPRKRTSILKSLPAPVATYQATISAPEYIHVGDPLSIHVQVQLLEGTAIGLNPTRIPITLTALSVGLELTWYAFGTKSNGPFVNVIPEIRLVDRGQPHKFAASTDGYAEATCTSKPNCLQRQVIPSFETFNVSVAYRLIVNAHFDCVKTQGTVRETLPIRILPKPRRPEDNGQTEGFVQGPQDVAEDWGPLTRDVESAHLISGKTMLDLAYPVGNFTGWCLQNVGVFSGCIAM